MCGKFGIHVQVHFNIPDHKCVCSLDSPLNQHLFWFSHLINDINNFFTCPHFTVAWESSFSFFWKISLTAYCFVCSTWLPLKSVAKNVCLVPVRLFKLQVSLLSSFPNRVKYSVPRIWYFSYGWYHSANKQTLLSQLWGEISGNASFTGMIWWDCMKIARVKIKGALGICLWFQ